ncbi:hypothetical protein MFIFM68171_05758 [Madurella fahalii]|uniref:Uncharacterized protein n=1 Tax=Madurella fahalii TaxID=1157608 RepID=A0ABQ0GCS0_9PEZI
MKERNYLVTQVAARIPYRVDSIEDPEKPYGSDTNDEPSGDNSSTNKASLARSGSIAGFLGVEVASTAIAIAITTAITTAVTTVIATAVTTAIATAITTAITTAIATAIATISAAGLLGPISVGAAGRGASASSQGVQEIGHSAVITDVNRAVGHGRVKLIPAFGEDGAHDADPGEEGTLFVGTKGDLAGIGHGRAKGPVERLDGSGHRRYAEFGGDHIAGLIARYIRLARRNMLDCLGRAGQAQATRPADRRSGSEGCEEESRVIMFL